ncbi:peptidase U32 family protein [Treponema sp. Marseille-Q4130]|uniref:peptidase U32 family protein n=1 Tax=Treponema sp. Marseille-Q4130 TaxID=2766702 RepID=UPI0016526F7B|nr:U32 family peptidase [Treponema sp. Marseille-Q4130]MBC6719269.1 U32 family peptidase [Treponema sp. Marseille-Q4130]
MELLSPAGNVKKLYCAYAYGADAAYIGLKHFSLRVKADNFYDDEYEQVCELKKRFPGKKLYCALNIAFHNDDIASFQNNIDYFKRYPIDAFIVQDLGIVPILQKEFPDAALHLSTQASCINASAALFYKRIGFKRIVLGREASLKEIREIKDAVPDMELEAFCHGAMCIAYSGRCLMSAYLTGRSAQSGFCSHTCRWNFSVSADENRFFDADAAKRLASSGVLRLSEEKRAGEYFPIFEGDNFTAVLSSKDLNMIDKLSDMKDAGIDAIKIEGRMKSVYYVALVTRAYRKALDALDGKISSEEAAPFIAELDNVPHRESTTGFYYSREDADVTTSGASDSPYALAAEIGNEVSEAEQSVIFLRGKKTVCDFQKSLALLCNEARFARERDLKNHPEKIPAAAEKKDGWHMYEFTPFNKIDTADTLEIISPGCALRKAEAGEWLLIDPETGTLRSWAFDGHPCVLYSSTALESSSLVRIRDETYVPERAKASKR